MIEAGAVPQRCQRTAMRVVGGQAVIMVIDRREIHRLNGVGTRVFELCDGAHDVDAITRAIVQEFDVDAAVASADVLTFLSRLHEVGAVMIGAHP